MQDRSKEIEEKETLLDGPLFEDEAKGNEKNETEVPQTTTGFMQVISDKNDFGIDQGVSTAASGTMEVGSLLGGSDGNGESLMGADDGGSLLGSVADAASFVEMNNDVLSKEEIEIRKKFFLDPKNQADILFENYVRSQPIMLNRRERRKAYDQFYKNAKKGMYYKVFRDQIYGVSKEKADKDFGKLN